MYNLFKKGLERSTKKKRLLCIDRQKLTVKFSTHKKNHFRLKDTQINGHKDYFDTPMYQRFVPLQIPNNGKDII